MVRAALAVMYESGGTPAPALALITGKVTRGVTPWTAQGERGDGHTRVSGMWGVRGVHTHVPCCWGRGAWRGGWEEVWGGTHMHWDTGGLQDMRVSPAMVPTHPWSWSLHIPTIVPMCPQPWYPCVPNHGPHGPPVSLVVVPLCPNHGACVSPTTDPMVPLCPQPWSPHVPTVVPAHPGGDRCFNSQEGATNRCRKRRWPGLIDGTNYTRKQAPP